MEANFLSEEIQNNSNQNYTYVIDRFEENFAVCERQEDGEFLDIDVNLLPQGIIEGMTIKYSENKYYIDYKNCMITKKIIIDRLKKNWIKEDETEYFIVSAKLDKALKCSNIFINQNIFLKDEEYMRDFKKGDIIKCFNNKYYLDIEKNKEIKNEINRLYY